MAEKERRRYDYDELWQYAVRTLGRRSFTTAELRQKLVRVAAEARDVELTIARLMEVGYLDDARYAESFALALLENEGFGKTRVLREMYARHIPAKFADEAVRKVFANVVESELVEKYIRRRIVPAGNKAELAGPRELATAVRKLMRAGFSQSTSFDALKRIAKEPELLDGVEFPQETDADDQA